MPSIRRTLRRLGRWLALGPLVWLCAGCAPGGMVATSEEQLLGALAGPPADALPDERRGGILEMMLQGDRGRPGESPAFVRYLESRGLAPTAQGYCNRVIREGRTAFVSRACP